MNVIARLEFELAYYDSAVKRFNHYTPYQRFKKWYLILPCLTLSIIRYGSRVKWRHPKKGVAPSTTPWCCSHRKGSIGIILDYGRQIYLYVMVIFCLLWRKSLTAITKECFAPYWTSPGGNTLQNTRCTATYHPSRKLSKLDEPDMQDTAREVRTNS